MQYAAEQTPPRVGVPGVAMARCSDGVRTGCYGDGGVLSTRQPLRHLRRHVRDQ